MLKKTLKFVLFLLTIVIFLVLFQYFNYWGIGAGLVIIFLAAGLYICWLVLVFIFKHSQKIKDSSWKLVSWLSSTQIWKKIGLSVSNKFPRLCGFLFKLFDTTNHHGIFLTVGLSVSLIFLVLFFSILQDLFFKDPLYFADLRIIYLLRTISSEQLDHFFVFFTVLGNAFMIIIGLILSGIYLLLNKKITEIKYLVLATGSGFILSYFGKLIFHRSRPLDANIISLPTSYSFPSGHALISICFYGFIFYIIFKALKNGSAKVNMLFSCIVLLLFIGVSRVYLGVHYPSDVLAGWYLGLSVLAVIIALFEIKNKSRNYYEQNNANQNYLAIIFFAIFIILSIFSFKSEKLVQPQKTSIKTTLNQFLKSASLYSETLFGNRMEPISFIIIGSEQKIVDLFSEAGWQKADPPIFKNIIKLSSAVAKNFNYATAPMTPSFYQSRTNDLGFEKATNQESSRQRHHTRYWKTKYTINNQFVWVVTASFDEKMELSSISYLPTHKISPDIDKERDFIMSDLIKTDLIKNYEKINIVGPTKGTNASGDSFYTDGQGYVIYLK